MQLHVYGDMKVDNEIRSNSHKNKMTKLHQLKHFESNNLKQFNFRLFSSTVVNIAQSL